METAQLIIVILTGIIAASTITYTIVTAFLLRATKKSVDLTRRALLLSALIEEAKLVFEETAKNPDGTARHGASRAPSRMALHEYRGKVRKFRKEMEEG
jgi:hypothetical protein